MENKEAKVHIGHVGYINHDKYTLLAAIKKTLADIAYTDDEVENPKIEFKECKIESLKENNKHIYDVKYLNNYKIKNDNKNNKIKMLRRITYSGNK